MADPLIPSTQESKLSALNKKIIEIKKKIQLSEGQRKANFEECDAKKRESCDKIGVLKKDVKVLQVKLAKAKNNEDAAERIAQTNRESSACVRKRGLEAAIARVDEDNIRLRKKLDMVKYQSDKQQGRLATLLAEYEELVNGKMKKITEKKLEHPLKKKIVSLENQLHRVSVMQMEADTVRKKYRCVRSSLKSDAAFYVSSLRKLEDSIKEQETEIKQLQEVKEEAVELRDITKDTLTKQEINAMTTSKARDFVILDYRQRVEDRKLELERLERMIFPATRQLPRDDFESSGDAKMTDGEETGEIPKDEVTRLEEAFAKLRSATGVTRTEDVLDRFLGQSATKEKLQKMRTVTEEEKMCLERRRQQLTAEIESQKFSETKDADQNAEELEQLNCRMAEESQRQRKAEAEDRRIRETLNEITRTLWKFCDRLRGKEVPLVAEPASVRPNDHFLHSHRHEKSREVFNVKPTQVVRIGIYVDTYLKGKEDDSLLKDVSDLEVPIQPELVEDPQDLLKLLEEKMRSCIELMGGPEKYEELADREVIDQFETSSIGSKSGEAEVIEMDERPLFPNFPGVTTPAAPAQLSEDEEEVPTRSVLKRQAQLLVDTKSRRKGFNFRR